MVKIDVEKMEILLKNVLQSRYVAMTYIKVADLKYDTFHMRIEQSLSNVDLSEALAGRYMLKIVTRRGQEYLYQFSSRTFKQFRFLIEEDPTRMAIHFRIVLVMEYSRWYPSRKTTPRPNPELLQEIGFWAFYVTRGEIREIATELRKIVATKRYPYISVEPFTENC